MSRLLHHQKPPAPNSAIRIMPTIATLIAQRIASRAIRKKTTSRTTPPIRKMVVKFMAQSVGSRQIVARLAFHKVFLLLTAHCSLFLITCSHDCLDVSPHVKVAFNFYAQGIAGVHEVFENHIDDMLVEDLHVPE